MDTDFMYVKYTQGDYFTIHLVQHHPWEFKPYAKLPRKEILAHLGYFDMFHKEFIFVPESEYLEWEAAEAAKAAEVHYCGDFGGRAGKDKHFCGKRVQSAGDRCEHHGGPGEHTCTLEELPRPEKGLAP